MRNPRSFALLLLLPILLALAACTTGSDRSTPAGAAVDLRAHPGTGPDASRGHDPPSTPVQQVILALRATALGLLVGVFFGWALVRALSDKGIDQFTVPIFNLVVIVILAALAGVLAAVVPGRRAAKLDVLKAVASE
jgi:hypothetical protein